MSLLASRTSDFKAACREAHADPQVNPYNLTFVCDPKLEGWPFRAVHHRSLHSVWTCRGNSGQRPDRALGVGYVQIRKSGSETLGEVMRMLRVQSGNVSAALSSRTRSASARNSADSVPLWTMVRDPLAHFVSGYTELGGRMCTSGASAMNKAGSRACGWEAAMQRKYGHRFFGSLPAGSVERVRAFVTGLVADLWIDFHMNGIINHVYAQCLSFCHDEALLRRSGWLYVGQLENFDHDLRAVLQLSGVAETIGQTVLDTVRDYRPKRAHYVAPGENRSKVGQQVVRQAKGALLHAFAEDPTTQRALCFLLAPDYACLNRLVPKEHRYRIPTQCSRSSA